MSESRPLPRWLPTAGIAAALGLLVLLSCVERWHMLASSPFPVGVDGYFYPVQLRSLLDHGTLYYPASPLAFWMMAPLAAATDPITGAKLGAALFGALVALPAYGVGARLGRCRGAGLVAAAIATRSAGSAFLTIEFVKNGIGLTVLLTAIWLLLRALESSTRRRIAFAVLGGVLALLTHKMAAGLLVVLAVPAIVAAATSRGKLRGRRLLYMIVLLATVTSGFVILGLAFPQRLPSASDVDLARTMFGGALRWDAPALVLPRATLTFGHEALIGGIVAIVAICLLSRRGRKLVDAASKKLPRARRTEPARRAHPGETALAWMIVIVAIVIAWPLLDVADPQGLGFRLRIAAFVPMSLAAAIVAGCLLRHFLDGDLILAAIAVLLALRTPGRRDEGRIEVHPAMVAAIQALADEVPRTDTIIVPERHIVYMVAWYVHPDTRIRPDHVPPERRWRVMPLAWIGMGSPLDKALLRAREETSIVPPLGLHPRHPNGLVLVAEATWQWVLDSLPPDVRDTWARWRTI